ncbi:hypothetical protein L2E82_25122 [Cichorium intybus]|uniref:Uncharacterized protein n=1 Tax=Cichorium intybus TaxID=13427 RepID=A0ACB9E2P8_CICIN|nr:hypothetical protein L2E82_25122 [Cichorium intybus]
MRHIHVLLDHFQKKLKVYQTVSLAMAQVTNAPNTLESPPPLPKKTEPLNISSSESEEHEKSKEHEKPHPSPKSEPVKEDEPKKDEFITPPLNTKVPPSPKAPEKPEAKQ